MPRTSRASKGGYVYHVLNRGNGRDDFFHKPDDFAAFVRLMREAHDHVPMRLTGYCLLNNHFHLLLWPRARVAVPLQKAAPNGSTPSLARSPSDR